jgi:hypothetical protein
MPTNVSSLRDRLVILDKEILDLDEKQSELSLQERGLQESRSLLIKEILNEEKPFEGTKWELFLGANNTLFFQYVEGNEEKVEDLYKLCFHSWHSAYEVQDGITLHFDDGVYSLHSSDPGQLKSFIKANNFIITANDISDKVKRLTRQLTSIQEICHLFNLKF